MSFAASWIAGDVPGGKAGVLAFEPRDTRLVRLGVRLGFGQEYEIAAVAENGLRRFDQTLPKARI